MVVFKTDWVFDWYECLTSVGEARWDLVRRAVFSEQRFTDVNWTRWSHVYCAKLCTKTTWFLKSCTHLYQDFALNANTESRWWIRLQDASVYLWNVPHRCFKALHNFPRSRSETDTCRLLFSFQPFVKMCITNTFDCSWVRLEVVLHVKMDVLIVIQRYEEVYWSLYNRLHNDVKMWFPLDFWSW